MPPPPSFFSDLQAGMSRRRLRREATAGLGLFLAGRETLDFSPADPPDASVIIVLFNQAALTLHCLQSLRTQTCRRPKVIIVDNGSTDETPRLLERVIGATIIRNTQNRGFLLAVNQAATHAKGDCLALLNSDAFLLPGSLDRAVRRLQDDAGIGVAGGRIILPGGRLQEAGPVVWRDAKAIGYGAGRSPDLPQFRIERDVDYVCGAFMAIDRALFEDLGGFDETFAPAYYEEMDFCFRARAHGRRVVYDPSVRLVHLNFGSSSPFYALRRMGANRRKMLTRHQSTLRTRRGATPANYLRAVSGRHMRPWILVIEDPARRASGLSQPTRSLIDRLLDNGGFVTLAYADAIAAMAAGRFWAVDEEVAGAVWSRFDAVVATTLAGARAVMDAAPDGLQRLRLLIDARQAASVSGSEMEIISGGWDNCRFEIEVGDPEALV